MTDYKLVLTTTGSEEEAQKIARTLVERRLAACVNVIGRMRSIYRWQGNVEDAHECLLIIKTAAEAVDLLYETIRELHSYELPETVVIAIEGGSEKYLSWIADSVT